jgi:hypothetical protein
MVASQFRKALTTPTLSGRLMLKPRSESCGTAGVQNTGLPEFPWKLQESTGNMPAYFLAPLLMALGSMSEMTPARSRGSPWVFRMSRIAGIEPREAHGEDFISCAELGQVQETGSGLGCSAICILAEEREMKILRSYTVRQTDQRSSQIDLRVRVCLPYHTDWKA